MALENEITEEEAQQELTALTNQATYHNSELMKISSRMIVLYRVLGEHDKANLMQQAFAFVDNVQQNPYDMVNELNIMAESVEQYIEQND